MPTDYGSCLLRLSDVERQKLQLVVAALKVSEYTDDVDDFRRLHNKEQRMLDSMLQLFDTITGLAIASDAVPRKLREKLLDGDTSITVLVPLLEDLFEILRRHKRLNPFDHRGEYGKLVMMLQDVQKPSIRRALKIKSSLIIPVRTVQSELDKIDCGALTSDRELKSRFLSKRGAEKAEGLAALVERYGGDDEARRAAVEWCLRSMEDVREFLLSNIDSLLALRCIVEREFEPLDASDAHNIAIRQGHGGACFTHSHATHCQYVEESLLLWENVQRSIFTVWACAEDDMLIDSEGSYSFVNTGQGFHRMCNAPKSYKVMSGLVRDTDRQMGGWVGIKVIHLGDRDVPNPLVFIDKYTIIPRIVYPIVQTLARLKEIFASEEEGEEGEAEDGPREAGGQSGPQTDGKRPATALYPGLKTFLRERYHSYEALRYRILCDFFKHAFDGSGDDGGTCIDGRLTSAWNWCHQLEKKPYYDAFVLTGFTGFD